MRTIKALELRFHPSLSPEDRALVKQFLIDLLKQELLDALETPESDQRALTGGYTYQQINDSIDLRLKLKDKHIKLGAPLYPIIDPIDLNLEEPLTELEIEIENSQPKRLWWT